MCNERSIFRVYDYHCGLGIGPGDRACAPRFLVWTNWGQFFIGYGTERSDKGDNRLPIHGLTARVYTLNSMAPWPLSPVHLATDAKAHRRLSHDSCFNEMQATCFCEWLRGLHSFK